MNSFAAAYRKSVALHTQKEFVAVYSLRGECVRKTFGEFHADVLRAITLLKDAQADQVVTIAGNEYAHLPFIVAAWLSGFPVCPINPLETPARIEQKIAQLGGTSFVLTADKMRFGIQQTDPPALTPDPERLMVLIFTSGSTGYSKIVEQREASILANAECLIDIHKLGPGQVICTPLPIFHVNALHFSFLCGLLSGAKLVLLENFVLPQAWEILAHEKANILSVVPQILRYMALEAGPSVPSLNYVVSAAAPLSSALASEFVRKFGWRICQGYGLSEAVNFSCLMPPTLANEEYERLFLQSKVPSIGPALSCGEVLLLDPEGKSIEVAGREGELALRGPIVMHGYRGERQPSVANGLFRTGDLGFFELSARGEKFFYISGRIKDIVKRGGLTISLREIDDVIAEFKDVECIAVPFANETTGEDVGLVFNCTENLPCLDLQAKLGSFLNERLPLHLRPSIAIWVKSSLRTASGKPTRWVFRPLFDEFKERNLGKSLRVFDMR